MGKKGSSVSWVSTKTGTECQCTNPLHADHSSLHHQEPLLPISIYSYSLLVSILWSPNLLSTVYLDMKCTQRILDSFSAFFQAAFAKWRPSSLEEDSETNEVLEFYLLSWFFWLWNFSPSFWYRGQIWGSLQRDTCCFYLRGTSIFSLLVQRKIRNNFSN